MGGKKGKAPGGVFPRPHHPVPSAVELGGPQPPLRVLLEPAPKQLSHIRTRDVRTPSDPRGPEKALGNLWAAQRPLPAGATEPSLGR